MSDAVPTATTATTTITRPAPAPGGRRARLPRLLSEPMWVLGLVVLVDEIDKNVVRGVITPLKAEFGVGDLGISVMLSLALLLIGLVTVPAGYLADRWNRSRAVGHTVVGAAGRLPVRGHVVLHGVVPVPHARGHHGCRLVGDRAGLCPAARRAVHHHHGDPRVAGGLTDALPAHLRGAGFGAFNLVSVIAGQAAAPFVVGALSAGFDENLRTAFLIVTPFSFLGAAILFRARRFLDADMQKIMLAVLTALQKEQARAQVRQAEQVEQSDHVVTDADRE